MSSNKPLNFAQRLSKKQPSDPTPNTLVPEFSGTLVPESTKTEPHIQVNDKSAQSGTRVPEYQSTLVPESNFYRKPNAASDKMDRHLTGAESKVLDHLLRLTIGFNTDRRQVRVELLRERTGYRSAKTVRVALFGLESKGIIRKISRNNDPLGDEYVILNSGTRVLEDSSTPVETTQVLESKITRELKTDLKDKDRSDDEAFALLRSVARELTGKEAGDWSEFEKVIVAELRIAAARTTVSNVPAFLAEHLRRRLWKLDKRQAAEQGIEPPDKTPAVAPKPPQDCPDCKGAGWWYPEGQDKGVAKCRHEKLK